MQSRPWTVNWAMPLSMYIHLWRRTVMRKERKRIQLDKLSPPSYRCSSNLQQRIWLASAGEVSAMPFTLFWDSFDACTSFDVCVGCLPFIHEWNVRAVTDMELVASLLVDYINLWVEWLDLVSVAGEFMSHNFLCNWSASFCRNWFKAMWRSTCLFNSVSTLRVKILNDLAVGIILPPFPLVGIVACP